MNEFEFQTIPEITVEIPNMDGLQITMTSVESWYSEDTGWEFYFINTGVPHTITFNKDLYSVLSSKGEKDDPYYEEFTEYVIGLPDDPSATLYAPAGTALSLYGVEGTDTLPSIVNYPNPDRPIGVTQIFFKGSTNIQNIIKNATLPITRLHPITDLTAGLAAPPPPIAAETPSSWAVEQVNAAIAAGLVPDALQSKYTAAATRAEFCVLAVALYETVTGGEIAGRQTFADTGDINIEKMAALGVVNGVGDNRFDPGTSLTREQAATILSRLANAMGKPLTASAATFADNASISSWAIDAVGQLQAAGIMNGVGVNEFSPAAGYTREQSILTMVRLYDIVK
jgi:hypothetical protein